jgi:hypothetical protein
MEPAADPLAAFIQAAKEKGATDEFLVALLRERGWPAKKIYAVLGSHYAEVAGVAIPEAPGRMESAREAFFHLLAFATLSAWICATGSIWFELIESWYPDPAFERYWSLSRVSWEIASIVVAFPVFVWATHNVLRELAESPDKAESAVRRWLTNLALFITALVFIGDLVSFVARFLGGGMTESFALKSLVVSVLAGSVFLYYSRGLAKAGKQKSWHRMFAWSAAISIGISIALGFGLNGSPATLRLYQEDHQRVQALHRVAGELTTRLRAPDDLSTLAQAATDPISGQAFEYQALGGTKYQLCATFGIATHPNARPGFWTHPAGRHCYAFDTSVTPAYPDQVY